MQVLSRSQKRTLADQQPGNGNLRPKATRDWVLPVTQESEFLPEPSNESPAGQLFGFKPSGPWAEVWHNKVYGDLLCCNRKLILL